MMDFMVTWTSFNYAALVTNVGLSLYIDVSDSDWHLIGEHCCTDREVDNHARRLAFYSCEWFCIWRRGHDWKALLLHHFSQSRPSVFFGLIWDAATWSTCQFCFRAMMSPNFPRRQLLRGFTDHHVSDCLESCNHRAQLDLFIRSWGQPISKETLHYEKSGFSNKYLCN